MTKIRVKASDDNSGVTNPLEKDQDTPQVTCKRIANKTDEAVVTLLEDTKDLDPRLLAVCQKYNEMQDTLWRIAQCEPIELADDLANIASSALGFDPLTTP